MFAIGGQAGGKLKNWAFEGCEADLGNAVRAVTCTDPVQSMRRVDDTKPELGPG